MLRLLRRRRTIATRSFDMAGAAPPVRARRTRSRTLQSPAAAAVSGQRSAVSGSNVSTSSLLSLACCGTQRSLTASLSLSLSGEASECAPAKRSPLYPSALGCYAVPICCAVRSDSAMPTALTNQHRQQLRLRRLRQRQ